MLIGKGISADEIFSVINSKDPVISAIDIISSMDSDSEGKTFSNSKIKSTEISSSQTKVEILKSVGNSLIDFDANKNTKETSYHENGHGIVNDNSYNNLSRFGFSNIRNRKELSVFLNKKRKEYNLDSSTLKDNGLDRLGSKEANSEQNSKSIYNVTNSTAKGKDYIKPQMNNSLSLKESNGGKTH